MSGKRQNCIVALPFNILTMARSVYKNKINSYNNMNFLPKVVNCKKEKSSCLCSKVTLKYTDNLVITFLL